MGQAFYEAFKDERVDCILTVEASGIAVAITTAQAFGGIPVVFAKKGDHRNVGHDVYTAQVYSFTHQTMNTVRVSRKYLPAGARVLIIDDFLANGEAIEGLRSIVAQAGCELVGAGVCVEKGFQPADASCARRASRWCPWQSWTQSRMDTSGCGTIEGIDVCLPAERKRRRKTHEEGTCLGSLPHADSGHGQRRQRGIRAREQG